MITTRSLGMLAIRSVASRRISALSLHTSALLLRTGSVLIQSRVRAPPEGLGQPPRLALDARHRRRRPARVAMPTKRLSSAEVKATLIGELNIWAGLGSTMIHIKALGISKEQAEEWLSMFPSTVRDEINALDVEQPQAEDAEWNLKRIADNMEDDRKFGLQSAFMTQFLRFAISQLESSASTDTSSHRLLESLQAIRAATDLRNSIEWYPLARSMRRKIIMHVGPTNSGKTYNALQALAGAPSGVYAGPLRLLAHEVWQRINKGSITPKQNSPNESQEPDKEESIVDLDDATPVAVTTEVSLDAPVVKSVPVVPPPPRAYEGRPCNLLTGEEQRIVSPTATVIACTVEMIPKHLIWDVGVIDEIQMLADLTRGGAWTSALLGLAARELHLCGEDTVVDLVRALCVLTGDELVINRYERLTPLEVESKSLRQNLKNVEPGDCVVTFSRAEIFDTKRRIEEATGLRCAVVYGRLPPEVRSEQAQLFNTEQSGYDVIVASDSVGMGLNLKIKRVVFMRTEKRVGRVAVPLPVPLIKQIGGRAGRFGVNKSKSQHHEITESSLADIAASQPPGLVSAFDKRSLQNVQKAMSTQNPIVTQARVDISNPNIEILSRALPARTGVTEILDIMRLLAITPPTMRLCRPGDGPVRDIDNSPRPVITSDSPEPTLPKTEDISAEIDSITYSLPMSERLIFALAPVRWRDPFSKAAALVYFRAYEHQTHVGVRSDIKGLGLLEALEDVKRLMKRGSKPVINLKGKHPRWPTLPRMTEDELEELEEITLQRLESFHSTLGIYMWLSYRLPLGFYQAYEAQELKAEVEKGIEWCLEQIKTKKLRRRMNRIAGPEVEKLAEEKEKEKPEAKIPYLTRDAVEQWRRRGSTPDAWQQLLKGRPKEATG
ncbi:RNA helicase [Ceratobasidium sp. 428]|nr:RNA helicase [Ceratobasidium sp. 428]